MKYDIAIIGGGMVGASFACAVQQNTTRRVLLVDAVVSHAEDHRLIALNHSSCVLFKNLGIWEKLAPHACAIRTVHVSQRGKFGITRLTAGEMELGALGYVVPAKEINRALYARLAELKQVALWRPAKLLDLKQHGTHVDLTLDTTTVQAELVIGADGTFSTVRDLLHIPTETIDYRQKALVTITELQRDHQHIAYERFVSNGAIAMLPLTGCRVATIWSGDEKAIAELLALPDEKFLQLLQEQFGYRLGKLQRVQQRFSYPLTWVKAKEYIKGRVLLLGNAAHTLHPIAAQGLNLALFETAVIAEHLATHLSFNDLPDCWQQQKVSMQISHRLTQLFTTDFFLFNAARQAGMVGLDLCALAKKRFTKRVLGRMGNLPQLLL